MKNRFEMGFKGITDDEFAASSLHRALASSNHVLSKGKQGTGFLGRVSWLFITHKKNKKTPPLHVHAPETLIPDGQQILMFFLSPH